MTDSHSDGDERSRVGDVFLGASALGLAGLAGVGANTADAETEYAVEEHDHSGKYDTATSLGEAKRVRSIDVEDLKTRQKPVVDVRAYGATGDGETDDHAALQAAFDAADDGDAVFLPPGTYVSSAAVTAERKALSVIGSGVGTTTLRFVGVGDGIVVTQPETQQVSDPRNVNLRGLTLRTTTAGGTAFSGTWNRYVSEARLTGTVADVEILGPWATGLSLTNAWNASIQTVRGQGDSTASETFVDIKNRSVDLVVQSLSVSDYDVGVNVSNRCEGTHVADSSITGATAGIVAGSGPWLSVTNTVIGATERGVSLTPRNDTYVANTTIEQADDAAVPFTGVDATGSSGRLRLVNNRVVARHAGTERNRGMAVVETDHCVASGNVVDLAGGDDVGVDVVDATKVAATKNVVNGGAHAVRLGALTEGCVATENSYAGSGQAVVDDGSQNLVEHNLTR